MNNEKEGFATDNRPAEVAMEVMNSYTARPDCTAARHTDARSLAVPVPRSTLIPTVSATTLRAAADAAVAMLTAIARDRLRTTVGKVYAFHNRVRVFSRQLESMAGFVPKRHETVPLRVIG